MTDTRLGRTDSIPWDPRRVIRGHDGDSCYRKANGSRLARAGLVSSCGNIQWPRFELHREDSCRSIRGLPVVAFGWVYRGDVSALNSIFSFTRVRDLLLSMRYNVSLGSQVRYGWLPGHLRRVAAALVAYAVPCETCDSHVRGRA